MTEQQDKPQTNIDNQVKLDSLASPKLTRTLSFTHEKHTYLGNIDVLPPLFPPPLVRQKACEDKNVYNLKCKNDELDKKLTCDTVQDVNSKSPTKH